MMTTTRLNILLICVAAALQLTLSASAAVMRSAAPPDPYAPVWVRGMDDPTVDTVVWVFYRAPEDVPSEFDLMQFFDWNDRDGNGIPDPWEYPLLLKGFTLYRDGLPLKASLREIDAVPVWFTSSEETLMLLQQTGTITFEQLSQMRSLLKGSAIFYHEELHPIDCAAQVAKFNYQGTGSLEDGRSFSFHVVGIVHKETIKELFSVEIE